MFHTEELSRYNRQYILPEIGINGQQKIKDARVLVIGAGGLGCPVLQYLTAAGVGTLGIVDFDKVDVTNLHRQILYTADDVGKSKAIIAAEKLSQQNSWVNFDAMDVKLDSSNALDLMKSYDIIVDGSDNFSTRYLVNDACILSNKPLVFGSIYKFEGQVSVFNYKGSGSYRCLFPQSSSDVELPNCATIGVLGVLPGIVGTIQATEVLKIILQSGDVLNGRLLVVDALSMNFSTYKYRKDPANFDIKDLKQNSTGSYLMTADTEIEEISPKELEQMIELHRELQLLDVREIDEYARKNIGGIHIPLGALKENVVKIKKELPVVVYCQSGARSRQAIKLLKNEFGFENVKNLKGGLNAWYAIHN